VTDIFVLILSAYKNEQIRLPEALDDVSFLQLIIFVKPAVKLCDLSEMQSTDYKRKKQMRHLIMTSGVCLMVAACTSVPQPITNQEALNNAASVRAEITSQQEPVTQSISLYEAMARALKYNLDHNVAMMEIDLAQSDFDLSRHDVLPQIVANGGYYGRINEAGASSLSLISGRESLEPSTSTDRNVWSGDLTMSWNVLDFGLSKIRSEQLADETLIYEERRRKAIIQIMEDVHRAYWRPVTGPLCFAQNRSDASFVIPKRIERYSKSGSINVAYVEDGENGIGSLDGTRAGSGFYAAHANS